MRKHGVYYDSRIKLLLILLTSALAFALGGGLTGLLLFGVVCLFALLSGLWKTSIKFAIVYIVLLVLAQVLPIHLSSVITFFLLRILTIALVIYILCAFLSFSPYTMLVVSPLWSLLAAITYFLVAAKTKKPWTLFIFCAITGIYGFYPPMIICCIIAGIISALIAWKTGCTNGKTLMPADS